MRPRRWTRRRSWTAGTGDCATCGRSTIDRADAFCYGIASHYLPNASGQYTRFFVGSYDFHLEKDGTAWRIHRFRFNLKYMDGNLELEGELSSTTPS
jgi:hypothetical protein